MLGKDSQVDLIFLSIFVHVTVSVARSHKPDETITIFNSEWPWTTADVGHPCFPVQPLYMH